MPRKPSFFAVATLIPALALLALSGCGDLIGGSCTAIGCLDGLSLSFDHSAGTAPADGAYTLTAKDNANGNTKTCELTFSNGTVSKVSGNCIEFGSGTVTLESFVPTNVTLTLSDASGDIASDTRTVTYTESRPNGPDCEPTCFQKTESFDISQ